MLEVEPGVRAVGTKLVSANEPYFVGHFPGAPVLPGVLVCEALVQLGAYLAGEEAEELHLVAVDRARFRRPAVPGDALRLEVTRRGSGSPWRISRQRPRPARASTRPPWWRAAPSSTKA